MSVITYDQIEVMPYELINLYELKIVKNMNEHMRLTLSGTISKENVQKYVKASREETQVKVFVKDQDGNRQAIFRGIAMDVKVKAIQDIYYLSVEAISHTYLLDITPKKRSFQNPNLTYTGLIHTILSNYQGAEMMDVVSSKKTIGTLVMQYEETDWAFLKRMASHFYSPLVSVIGYGVPKFYFGLPMGLNKGELIAPNYKVVKKVAAYQTAIKNRIPGVREEDFIQYEVESNMLLEPGDEVIFNEQKLLVAKATLEMKKGILNQYYVLSPRSGVRPIKSYNESIIGASINAKVIDIRRDTIRAKLDMDDQEDSSSDYWFPYSTIYASENNAGWYFMPEKNDSVRIYFPSHKEEEGIAISSVAKQSPSTSANSSSQKSSYASKANHPATSTGVSPSSGSAPTQERDVMSDPGIKTLRTKYGKEIMLAQDKIVITSGGMTITLSDQDGITINSSKDITISAGQNISMTSSNINISASKIELAGNGNTIVLDQDIHLKGSEIKMN